MPTAPPDLTIADQTAHFGWNGATGVAEWRLLPGPSVDQLSPLTTIPWNGNDVTTPVGEPTGVYQIQAIDSTGQVLGQSDTVQAS